MEGRKCPVCGAVSEGKFCTSCGHRFAVSPQQPQNPQPVQRPQQPVQQPQYQRPAQQPQYQRPAQQPQYQAPVPGSAQRPVSTLNRPPQQGYAAPLAPPVTPAPGPGTPTPEPPKKKKSRLPLIIVLSLAAVLLVAAATAGIVMLLGDNTYTVVFDPDGGKIVSGEAEQEVKEGLDAKAPEVKRNGWFFEGWDGDYSNVTKDITVTALWTQGVTVTFDPGEGEITQGESEQYLESGSTPVAPDAVRVGYKLTGWEPVVGAVTEDTVYTAQWELIEYTPEELYEMATPSVVEIHVYDRNGEYFAQGSGFFIDGDGTIVTNYHVIEDAYSAEAITSDEAEHSILQVIAWDKELDLAIIKSDVTDSTPLPISEHAVSTGEAVYTLGSSLGLTGTISDGIVSTASRDIDGVDCIQITAPISHGNSGGPLLNRFCEVIGINSMSLTDGQNLNFAINIHELDNLDQSSPLTMEEFYDETGTGEDDYMNDPGAAVFTDSDYTEVEYNNVALAADTLHAGTDMGGYVDPYDWDYFTFTLSERSEVNLELIPYYYADGEYLWSVVLDEDLNIVDTLDLDDSDPDFCYLGFTDTLSAGTYYVYVEIDDTKDYPYTIGAFYWLYFDTGSGSSSGSSGSSSGSGSSGDYPDNVGASVFDSADFSEIEPNNYTFTADPLLNSFWTAGYCDESDTDCFSFELSSTGFILVSLIPYYQQDLDYLVVYVMDSNETVIDQLTIQETSEGNYLGLDTVLSAGTYYLCVSLADNYSYDVGTFYELAAFW